MEEKTFFEELVDALAHIFFTIVYILFIVPFELYAKAVHRLAEQRRNNSLSIKDIDSPWPFFTLLWRLNLYFIFDFTIVISWGVGIIAAIVLFFSGITDSYDRFQHAFGGFFAALICAYYMPVLMTWFRDFAQFSVLPLKKYMSWLRKPAQHVDLTMDKEKAY